MNVNVGGGAKPNANANSPSGHKAPAATTAEARIRMG